MLIEGAVVLFEEDEESLNELFIIIEYICGYMATVVTCYLSATDMKGIQICFEVSTPHLSVDTSGYFCEIANEMVLNR